MAIKHKEFFIGKDIGRKPSTLASSKSISDVPTTTRLLITFPLSFILKMFYVFGGILRFLLVVFALAVLLSYGLALLPFNNDMIRLLLSLGQVFQDFYMPYIAEMQLTMLIEEDVQQPVLIGITFLLSWILGLLNKYARQCHHSLAFRKDFKLWTAYKGRVQKKVMPQGSDIKRMMKHSNMSVQEMCDLSDYMQSLMDAMKKDITFLSMDVLRSDRRKGETVDMPDALNFKQKNHIAEKVLNRYNPLNTVWTKDGLVGCFATADQAVHAAEDIFSALQRLHANQTIELEGYAMYCGMNSGKVAYDGSVPLTTLCDHVLDITKHFQKFSLQDRICVSENTYMRLSDKSLFEAVGTKIDGFEVYVTKQ